jgi:hypothetical protein
MLPRRELLRRAMRRHAPRFFARHDAHVVCRHILWLPIRLPQMICAPRHYYVYTPRYRIVLHAARLRNDTAQIATAPRLRCLLLYGSLSFMALVYALFPLP